MASRFTKLHSGFPGLRLFIHEKQSANGYRNAQQSCACTSSCSCTSRSSCWRTYGASAELLPSVIKLSALYPYGFDLSIHFNTAKTESAKKHKTLSRSGRGFVNNHSGFILKRHAANGNGVAVADAERLHAFVDPGVTQRLVEIHPALVVGEVDGRNEAVHPRAGDVPDAVVLFDLHILG